MSEFQKVLFIVSFSLILLTMVISTEIMQNNSFSIHKAIFLFTHDALRAWQNSNRVVFSFTERYLEGKQAGLAKIKAKI